MKNTIKITILALAIVSACNANASIIQMGTGALGLSDRDIAIGDGSSANGGMSLGPNATSGGGLGCYAMALGSGASAVCVGTGGSNGSLAIGQNAKSNYNSVAIGELANAQRGVAVGNSASAGDGGAAFGHGAKAAGPGETAIGNGATTAGNGFLAVGSDARASAFNSVAIAGRATAINAQAFGGLSSAQNATSIGYRAIADQANTVSVGRVGEERRIVNVAFGTSTYDVVVYGQIVPAINGIVSGLGGGASYNATTGVMTAPSYALSIGTYTNVGSALAALDGAIAGGGGSPDPLAMRYDDASKATSTMEGAAGTQIKNVADGTDPMDAVNKRQLDGVDTRVSDTRTAVATGMSYIGDGASYNPTTGVMTAPNIIFMDGTNHNNVSSALHNLDGRVSTLESNPVGGVGPAGPQGPAGNDGSPGPQGPAGQNGSDGAPGPQGPAGPAGQDGTNGSDGSQGPAGPTGQDGGGTTGPQGPAGQDGTNGTNGTNGADGAQGPAGQDGTNGTNGTNGSDGAQGPAGQDGTNGTNGTNGADGAQGPAGQDGTNGTNGAEGAQGTAGHDGVDGQNGTNGTNGSDGAQGPAGQDGVDGQNGIDGSDAAECNRAVCYDDETHRAATLAVEGTQVRNVSDGRIEQGSRDAVNGGQIWAIQQDWNDRWTEINHRMDGLEKGLDAVGAQSAAMAQMGMAGQYLPVGKISLNLGYGQYGSAKAFAVGAKVRLTERSAVSIGFSSTGRSGGKLMIGAGYSYVLK